VSTVLDGQLTEREVLLVQILEQALERVYELESELSGVAVFAARAREQLSRAVAVHAIADESLRVIAVHCQQVRDAVTSGAVQEEEGHAHPDGPGH
jgi:hypothetical protein